ncbi:hypothetical protein D3C72_1148560 [compost metagenome]
MGGDHGNLPVFFGPDDGDIARNFGCLYVAHSLHLHVLSSRADGFESNRLARLFFRDADLAFGFRVAHADLLASVLLLKVDFALHGDFFFGCRAIVFGHFFTALAVYARLFASHDLVYHFIVRAVADVHELDGLDGIDAPFGQLGVDCRGKSIGKRASRLHDVFQLVRCQHAAHGPLDHVAKLVDQDIKGGHALGGKRGVFDAEERGDVDFERQPCRVIGSVILQVDLEVAFRELGYRHAPDRHPAWPVVVGVAAQLAAPVRRGLFAGLHDVHHVGGHNAAQGNEDECYQGKQDYQSACDARGGNFDHVYGGYSKLKRPGWAP